MNLKEWRKGKKLTQGELAEKLGLVENTYQAYESGRITITSEIQAKIRKMGFAGNFPEQSAAPPTIQDVESLREEMRTQAKWVREECRKDSMAVVAEIQKVLTLLSQTRIG